MEGRKGSLTPENYTRAIISLSRRYSSTSAFPGNNYLDIGEWMLLDRNPPNPSTMEEKSALFVSQTELDHALVVVYNSGEKKWDVQQYSQQKHVDFSTDMSIPGEGLGQIVFIRGFISPSWVSVIGGKYKIDPEFFRRHMDFLSAANVSRHSYSFPSLASSSNNIFRLCVNTVLQRDNFFGQDLQFQRSHQSSELGKYKLQLLGSTRTCCGDSIVREYSTVCSCFSVIEQWISFCVTRVGKGWTVIVWMDQGKPLERSPPGPWTSHFESKASALPILQHHPKMAFRTTKNNLDTEANASAWVQQSTVILPLQYDSLVALVDLPRRASHSPLFMGIPLFAHAAFSEVQFLNLMQSKIQIQIDIIVQEVPADALETLQYFSTILNRHAQQLQDSIHALRRLNEFEMESLPGTDKTKLTANSSDGTFSPKGLLGDYDQLYGRCIDLSKLCTQGITLAMNKATIEESRKAIEQSKRLKKLTLLATLFIPLTFTSSLLGMNVDLLGQNAVGFWWFFVLCVPITVIACAFYFLDMVVLRRLWIALCKRCRAVRRDQDARDNKDPGYTV